VKPHKPIIVQFCYFFCCL